MLWVVRVELNYGPSEWAALPWHHQRLFIEKLIEKGKLDPPGGGGDGEPSWGDLYASGATVEGYEPPPARS